MVLGGNNLFETPGLFNEIGELKERWGQEGSEVISDVNAAVEDETVYTVTSGKKFYVKAIDFGGTAVDNTWCYLRDGGAAGDTKVYLHAPTQPYIYHFEYIVPIVFETSVYIESNDTAHLTLIGWEE